MAAVAGDDQPHRHFSTKHRIISWISQHLFDNVIYTVHHGLNKGMQRLGGLGWLPEFLTGSTETPEHTFWSGLDLRDLVVYDVGAFEGLLTLYFARQARTVISYEPNTRNHTRLVQNLRLNRVGNVVVRKLGVGSESRTADMIANARTPGGASIAANVNTGRPNSKDDLMREEIIVVRLDDDIREASLPAPDFIKIDVEGLELAVLIGARETIRAGMPQLFIELHGETMNLKRKNAREVVDYLQELGYNDIRHIESGMQINSATASDAAEGHLYCASARRT